jgi:hypothetical protein
LSKRKSVRFAIRFTALVAVLGTAAAILAGFSALAMRSSRALPFSNVLTSSDDAAEPQLPNRALKANRVAALLPVALTSGEQPGFMLASAPQSADLERFYSTVTATQPMMPVLEREWAVAPGTPGPEPTAFAPAPKKAQGMAALAVVPDKPKRLPPAPPAASNMLDDGAIAGLKARLRLSADQMQYWPAVESALRDVARTQLRHTGKQMQGRKINIDVNSPEVQQLIWAAMPLLTRLRDEQKSEVRNLARIMGLEQVASQI